MEDNNLTKDETTNEIDFDSIEFESAQKLLKDNATVNSLIKASGEIKEDKNNILNNAISGGDADDIIQKHLDEFKGDITEFNNYLSGKIDSKLAKRIDSFFTNDETGEVLTLVDNDTFKTRDEELDFKRGMLIYFKQNDYYLSQIDNELKKLDEATAELNENVSKLLDPLKDNVLAYATHLEDASIVNEDDDRETIKKKEVLRKKALSIKDGYTLDRFIKLVSDNPSIAKNALHDFRNETRVKDIGRRYNAKISTNKIGFNLFPLLSDDIHDSLEYRCLPKGDYPDGLENFTVFFIIRYMAMGLNTKEDIVLHASLQVALTRLVEGSLDEDVESRMKESIIKLLSFFK